MIRYKGCFAALALFLILGNYKGYLALYEGTSTEPRQVYPCRIQSLPQADQVRLEDGIRIRDLEMLSQLLEDFLS